ncbi:MAG: ATP-dependent Clp protease adaptor ClpS [Bacteroidales bacterium]|jgi:ATP-dependent Clp protease adaptor protein ClpS|nr:ATP-dependent Clp protease adaptor ClpS [Bacteroidales bacterium]
MVKKAKENINPAKDKLSSSDKKHVIVLFNDDFNSFDYVIECLVEVCDHDMTQAEQCAFITHYNGKCDVKNGNVSKLKPLKDRLIEKGLNVNIQ